MPYIRLFLLALLLPCALLPLRAQSSSERFTVSGSVVNSVTGAPIRRALVQLAGPEQHSAFTGSDGHFEIAGVASGQYFPRAQKPGFFDVHGVTAANRIKPLAVGVQTPAVLIKLEPEASIEGRVMDSDGTPISSMQIQCLQQNIVNGHRVRQPVGGSQTAEDGTFHVEGLRPGVYVVATQQQQLFPGHPARPGDSEIGRLIYPLSFFPNAREVSSAQPITLRSGEKAEVDFTLSALRAFRVSGTIAPSTRRVFITAATADGIVVSGSPANPRNGEWQLPAMAPGSWMLNFQVQDSQNGSLSAEQAVTVSTADIQNLQVALQPMLSIPVTVAGTSSPAQLQVRLLPDDAGLWNRRQNMAIVQPSNPASLVIPNVAPGSYSVAIQAVGTAGACVNTVSSGNLDLTRNSLLIAPGSQPAAIQVEVADNCGSIQGRVRLEKEGSPGVALLLPASHAVMPQTVPLASDGTFSFTQLGPGDYQVYALSDVEGLEYANPEALRGINGEHVSLTPKQTASVNLELITREGN